jgi:hypothetical protein
MIKYSPWSRTGRARLGEADGEATLDVLIERWKILGRLIAPQEAA